MKKSESLRKWGCPLVMMVLSCLSVERVYSHAQWDVNGLTPPRSDQDDIKHPTDPQASDYCGVARTNNFVALESGAEVTLSWEARIYHQGYFRIALSERDDTNFNQHILLDNYREIPGQRYYSETIRLPDIACDACTLQLIQVMEDRDPASFYYSCSDVSLSSPDIMPPADLTPPNNVSNASARAGDAHVQLSWQNPVDDFYRVVILQQTTGFTSMLSDGVEYQVGDQVGHERVIYVGASSAFQVTNLSNGTPHTFRIYAYDSSFNYASGVSLSATPEIVNVAPVVNIEIEQNMQTTTQINTSAGHVVVQANVTDLNLTDSHEFDWSATDPALVDIDPASSIFTFDPSNLNIGNYIIDVNVSDNGAPALSTRRQLEIQVIEMNQAPELRVQIWQGGTNSALVKSDKQDIRLEPMITDANLGDNHTLTWRQISGPSQLTDIEAGDNFVFSSSGLAVGDYVIELEVVDDGEPALTTRINVEFEVRKPRAGSISLVFIFVLFSAVGFLSRRYAYSND